MLKDETVSSLHQSAGMTTSTQSSSVQKFTMSSENFSIPDLTQEEQEILHNAFAKDLEDLKTNKAISPLFCDIFVTICKTPSLSLFTDKEAQNILQLRDLRSKREAVLKGANEKGAAALVVFYLLLHMNDEIAYGKLPSYKENDEKMALISKLKNKSFLENKEAEISKTIVKHSSHEKDRWEAKYEDDEDEKPPAYETVVQTEKHHLKPYRGRWAIKKGDIFFHFITLCFALGTVLVVEHNYSDWTVSAGIGLISFAVLEAIGIYFNFVNRVRTVARAILRVVLNWAEKFPLALKNR